MGEARRRGDKAQRRAQAIQRNAETRRIRDQSCRRANRSPGLMMATLLALGSDYLPDKKG